MHAKLKENWLPPAAPANYPDITAVRLGLQFEDDWYLDFSRLDESSPVGRFFAGDADCCPLIDWPWVVGFCPQAEDWRAIGFVVLEFPTDEESIKTAARALISKFIRGDGVTLH